MHNKFHSSLIFCITNQKRIIGVSVALMTSTVVHAQSSVTLYGSIDLGVDFASNVGGAHQYRMASAVGIPTRWGLTGNEDLGQGQSAIFKVESGFDATNGALSSGLGFSRQAYVGIKDERFGTLTLGRQWSPLTVMVGAFSLNVNYGGWYFSHPNDVDNLDYTFSIPSAIKYASPKIGGASVEALYSFGGQPGQFSNGSSYSAGVDYSVGQFSAAIAYLRVNDPQTTVFGYQSGGGYVNSVYGTYLQNARSQQIFGVGASYAFGSVRILGNFTDVNFQQGAGNGQDVKFQNYELATSWNATSALALFGGYTLTDGRNHATDQQPRYQQFNIGANYQVSKRTALYAIVAVQKASGGAVAQIAGFNPSSNGKQVVGHVGINHVF